MEQIDAKQELDFIKKIMADSRTGTVDNGLDFIVWGVLVALGLFSTFTVATCHLKPWWSLGIWLGIAVVGWGFSIANHRFCARQAGSATFGSRMVGQLWLACGVAIMIFVFIGGVSKRVDPSPAAATVLGIGYYLSGLITESRWLRVLGFVWWAGAAFMFLWLDILTHTAVLGSMMLLFQVVPGIILYRRWRTSRNGG